MAEVLGTYLRCINAWESNKLHTIWGRKLIHNILSSCNVTQRSPILLFFGVLRESRTVSIWKGKRKTQTLLTQSNYWIYRIGEKIMLLMFYRAF